MDGLRSLWKKAEKYFSNKLKEESSCGKCAVCHRVCKMLDKKPNGPGGQ